MNKALIVDDIELNREMLSDILSDEYEVIEAGNGNEALEKIEENFSDLSVILLDLVMPELDGTGVLKIMKDRGWIERFPVLIITGETDVATELKCLELGAADFIGKPFDESRAKRRVANSVQLYTYKNRLEEQVAEKTAELRKSNQVLEEMNDKIIQMLGDIVESRNEESGEHVKRVKIFTKIFAEYVKNHFPEYGLTDEDVELIATASPLHDVGKIMVKDAILLKPGKLTPEEFAEMKKHTIYGCEVLDRVRYIWPEKYNRICSEICLNHHERVDGRGYPNGLKGDDIPVSAQIVGLADVYDALVTDRVYKKAFHPDTAFDMILNGDCGTFSEKMTETFKACREEIEKITKA